MVFSIQQGSRDPVNDVHCSEYTVSPKMIRHLGLKFESSSNFQNMFVLSFCNSILLRSVSTSDLL
ncbi:unnamed protein product [Rhodiola kirilowii]